MPNTTLEHLGNTNPTDLFVREQMYETAADAKATPSGSSLTLSLTDAKGLLGSVENSLKYENVTTDCSCGQGSDGASCFCQTN